ncbi:MAG: T9SS type A sorting domain-containing protein [Candidatus Krumholzibacteria bacterium]|nr:T9SS type A sorting domain-containing protein [Candidatus Krumholzibacteria bacterium]
MKYTWLTILLCVSLLLAAAEPLAALTPAHFWSQRLGGATDDYGAAVAVDASGDVLTAGYFTGTINLGGSNLVSAGARDIYLAKFSADGTHVWSQRYGGTSDDYAFAVSLDSRGYVFIAGYFSATVNFGGSDLVSAGSSDIYVACFEPNGAHSWSRRFGSTAQELAQSLAIAPTGNVIIAGSFSGTVDFGSAILVSAGSSDAVVVALTAGGGNLWSRRGGSNLTDNCYGVDVDASGNVFATGTFYGTANFGGGDLVSAGANDIWLTKYNSSGVHQWSRRMGGASFDYGYGVAADASGAVVVTGTFYETVDFGGGDLVSAGSSDVFLARYNAAGAHQWSKRFGGTSYDYGYAVATGTGNDVFVTGSYRGTANFGGGNVTSNGVDDLFLARYDEAGAYQWDLHAGGTSIESSRAVAVDPWGNTLVTGYFGGTTNLGGSPLTSAGGNDVFLARYGPRPAVPTIASVMDVANDEGRRVRVAFNRSGFDVPQSPVSVTGYEVYRRIDTLPLMATPPRSARLLIDGWVYAGELTAHGTDTYFIDAPTDADSTIAFGQHYSTFFVRAATVDKYAYFDSPADSGYSVDNLAPAIPGGLLYGSGTLSWNKSAAEDFDYFTVYGSPTQYFADATLVDHTIGTSMDVTGHDYQYVFVTATDFSGNESGAGAIKVPSGVGGTPRGYILSVSNFPNPFNPSTVVSYTVPSRGSVTVAIYDARGARVATLVDSETRDAGAYRADWNGRSDSAVSVPSGIYFARIEQNGAVRTRKMVLLK